MTASFKSRLRQHEPMIGTWIKTPSPMVCEVLSKTELDVLCLDAEHSPFDRRDIDQCLYALRSEGMPSLVRTPTADEETILNALDCGATGVVVPHVRSPRMASEVAAAAHFQSGGRGYAGSTRAAGYTTKAMADHLQDSRSETAVIAQIEDLEALEVLDEIAAVEDIDCLFVGRIDLTIALGASSPRDEEVVQAVERICAAGAAANRAVGMFVSDVAEIPHWRDRGASLFLLTSDHGFLLQGAQSLVDDFRGA